MDARRINRRKTINGIHHVNRKIGKNHMTISIDVEETFEKMQHFFLIMTLSKIGIERSFL